MSGLARGVSVVCIECGDQPELSVGDVYVIDRVWTSPFERRGWFKAPYTCDFGRLDIHKCSGLSIALVGVQLPQGVGYCSSAFRRVARSAHVVELQRALKIDASSFVPVE